MHIRKFDFNYGRRQMMKNVAMGAGAGVLMPLDKVFAAEEGLGKAYPDELMSIEMITKGKIKPGDFLSADNVDIVKDLLDPIVFDQVKNDGRRIKIRATETDISRMFPHEAYTKTLDNLQNGKKAQFDADGNVVSADGSPWSGGLPFPNPTNGEEAQANMAMSWGRGDYNQYAINDTVYNPDGSRGYSYDLVWAELQVQARTDGSVFRNMNDLLRLQTVLFTATQDVAGSSFMSVWYYDQRKFPDLYGYLPQFRRVRQFPTNQRFEPLIPGVTWFLSDAWAAGDPMRTWGEYKIIERKPMLGAFNSNMPLRNKNWQHTKHGGAKGETYFDVEYELAPEVIVLESKPVGYPRAPVGRRLTYIDVRNSTFCGCIRFDRQDKPWVNFEAGFSRYEDGDKVIMGPDGKNPAWSWTYVMSFDAQSRRMSQISHLEEVSGGYKSVFDASLDDRAYSQFFTQQALQRLGQV